MPTLFRLLTVVAIIGAATYGAMWSVVTFVRPQPRVIEQIVPVPGFTRAASPILPSAPPAGIATAAGDTRIGRSVATTLEDQALFLTRHRHVRQQAR